MAVLRPVEFLCFLDRVGGRRRVDSPPVRRELAGCARSRLASRGSGGLIWQIPVGNGEHYRHAPQEEPHPVYSKEEPV